MATKQTATIEELTKLATDFVTSQKGLWDHTGWTAFLEKVKAKGFDLSQEMQSNLGAMLEAMKQLYSASASTESMENAMKAVVNDSVDFVKRHKGTWDHPEWEDFVNTVRRNTLNLSEGTTAYLGGVLESIKTVYSVSPMGVIQERITPTQAKAPAAAPAASAAQKKPAAPAARAAGTKAEKASVAAKSAPKGNVKDDLTAIGGIGPVLAKKLNDAGIHSFAQIAAFSDKDIERLEKSIIKLSGRIKRDDWVGQAKKLS